MPPLGKLDASGSPWIERLAGELGDRAALAVGRQEAVVLLGGRAGERMEDVRVVRRALRHAQSFIAAATTSATFGSSGLPVSIVCFSDLNTSFGRCAFMAA